MSRKVKMLQTLKTQAREQLIINSAHKAHLLLLELYNPEVEEFWAIALRTNKALIKVQKIFMGTVDQCFFHPRDVLRFACLNNASGLIVAHNHPSLDPLPSMEDHRVTRQLTAACRLVEVPLIDHIVFTATDYWSYADNGWAS